MDKSIYTGNYTLFLQHLCQARRNAGMTQEEVGIRLGKTQSFVSKYERGERRLDIIEVNEICEVIGISLTSFVADLSEAFVKP